ncbi:hypothetical protein LCGC14_2761010 [marine sediment metagenome]|uniref:Uncharacterized protein n=2 Tax=root TaxID=1 RepID=A0A0F8YYY2_9ZZZZ|nr:MAG: hypothetical protein LCMAC202_00710 [Marseillevirus LCMAC202]
MSYFNPTYAQPPTAPRGGRGKKVIGIIVLLLAVLVIGGFIAATVYFYTRPRIAYTPVKGGQPCNNGSIKVPVGTAGVTPSDGVTCNTLGNYNNYPLALFDGSTPAVSFNAIPNMDNTTCAEECDGTSTCVCYACKLEQDGGTKCTCTGYSALPIALKADLSKDCMQKGQCTYIGIQRDAI